MGRARREVGDVELGRLRGRSEAFEAPGPGARDERASECTVQIKVHQY